MHRSIGFHLIQSYLPSILIVSISWVSFWMDVDCVPARVTLGVITLLTVSSRVSGKFKDTAYYMDDLKKKLCYRFWKCKRENGAIQLTTLQSMMNVKLSKQRFRHCNENGLIQTIQTTPHNLYVSVKLTSLYCGLRLILVYPNPQ